MTVDTVVICPQCSRLATRTFDCKANSKETSCHYCGYSEYRGPKSNDTHPPSGRRVHTITSGYGVIAVQSPNPEGAVFLSLLGNETEFLEELKWLDQFDRGDYSWALVTRWNAAIRENDVLRSYLKIGHQAPQIYLDEEVSAKDSSPTPTGDASYPSGQSDAFL